jgi:hypothetical protein
LSIQTDIRKEKDVDVEGDPLKTPLPASPTVETLLPPHEENEPDATTEATQLPAQDTKVGEKSREDDTPRAEKLETASTPAVLSNDEPAIESQSKPPPTPPPETPSKNQDPPLSIQALLVPPPKTTQAGLGSTHSTDPLSAREKTPPPPPPVPKDDAHHEYNDPLTPGLQELEREQKAAAARSLRSPASPQPPPTPRIPHQHHQATRSTASISMVPEGEPFIRLHAHSHSRTDSFPLGLVGAFSSIEGMEGVNDVDGVKNFVRRLQEKLEVKFYISLPKIC